MRILALLLAIVSVLTIISIPTAHCKDANDGNPGTNGKTGHGGKVAVEAETGSRQSSTSGSGKNNKTAKKGQTATRADHKRDQQNQGQGKKLSEHRRRHHHKEQQVQGKGNKPGATPNPAAAAALLSDLRVKTNVSFVGWSPMGIPIYRFSYISEPNKRYQGTIAQALTRIRPEAVISRNGLMYVDYSQLDVEMGELPEDPVQH